MAEPDAAVARPLRADAAAAVARPLPTSAAAARPLRADAARNREKVLRAARDAFAESGYGVPLDEIATRAGVGPGTVYRHFPTKEALFEAVVTVRVQDLVADARARADASDPGGAFFGFLARITAEFDQASRAAERGLPSNRFAAVRDGRLKLKRRDALPIPRAVHQLRATIGASLSRVRIEDLLQDVDEWCGFTRAFQPLGGYQPRGADPHRSLLATLIAHGTNLGLAAMSQSIDSLTAETLQDTSRWFLRDATLKAANTIMVDHHHGLKLSGIWGRRSR